MHIVKSRDLHLLLLDPSVLDGLASPESTQELVVASEVCTGPTSPQEVIYYDEGKELGKTLA